MGAEMLFRMIKRKSKLQEQIIWINIKSYKHEKNQCANECETVPFNKKSMNKTEQNNLQPNRNTGVTNENKFEQEGVGQMLVSPMALFT